MSFETPQSTNEAILQNMLGASNEIKPPQSRVEKLLQELSGQMPEANPSEGTTTGTLERLKIGNDIYTVEGGGSGTSDYDALNNKPQIAGVTLSGDKSLADLGIASATTVSGILDGASIDSFADVETALAGKQDTLTFDNTPTENSTNPVKSGGIYSALAGKADTGIVADDFDSTASYVIGNYCIENGKLYKFKANHSGAWSASDVDEIQITGELATLKSGFTNLDNEVNGDATVYPYADVITVPDAIPANVADCKVKIEPVQDLHGQSAPYVGGAGKNKLPLTVDGIKAANTTGTWTGNVYALGDLTFEILTDESGVNVNGIKVSGTNGNSIAYFKVGSFVGDGTSYILNGCPENGSTSTYNAFIEFTSASFDNGSGVTFNDSGAGNVYIRINSQYVIPTGGLTFYPMIRLSTETDATFAPYTNICPITGHTKASVQRDGKNLFNKATAVNNKTVGNDGAEKADSGCFCSDYISIKPNNTYYLSNVFGENWANAGCLYDSSKTFIRKFTISGSGSAVSGSYTVSDTNAAYIRINGMLTSIDEVQVELGSSATDFEPFKGKTYTIALGDTIYGGTVDFNTGVMTVTKKYIEYDGSNDEEWIYYDLRNCYSIPRPSDSGRDLYAETNQFKHGALYSTTAGEFYFGNDNLNINSVPMFATLSDWITHLSNNPLQLCYELATPLTIQLTPQQIQLLKGQNTLTASTGQISVTVNGVSGAIGSLTSDKQDKTDYALNTTAKTVVGGINELKNRVKVIEVTTSDTVDQGTTVQVPTGYDAAKAIIAGYTAQRTNNLWYNADDHVVVGMYSEYLYVVPKNVDVLEQTVKVVLIKFSA